MTETVFEARDGAVFYRGCFHTPEEIERVLRQLRASGEWAKPLVHQLETAISEAYEDVHA